MLNKVKSRFAEKNFFSFSIIGKYPLRDTANVLNQIVKIKTSIGGEIMLNHFPAIKRAAFLILLLIVAYYVRRDIPAVLAHPELLRGLAIFFLVALSGLLFALGLQVHKEKVILQKKLGEKTYDWLVSAESGLPAGKAGTKPDRGQ